MKIRTRLLSDKGLNQFELGLLRNIRRYGWHVNGIGAEGHIPNWAYSVGIYAKYGQPEVIMFGLDIEVMYEMISGYVAHVKEGKSVVESAPVTGILKGHTCAFRNIQPQWRDSLLRSASWYYHGIDFPAMQCFWMDRSGKFPWDRGVRKLKHAPQPLLYQDSMEKTGMSALFEETPWKFEDSPDTACFTSRFILDGEPVTFVSHDFDGDWQFHGDQDPLESEPLIVGLSCMVSLDSSIEDLHDLPCGWAAERKSPRHKWRRFRNHPFPTFEEDGYYLDDVALLSGARDDLAPPSKRRRENCRVGDYVKLLFRFAEEAAPREDGETERMWVVITEVDKDEGIYTGKLDNDPVHTSVSCGDVLQFHPDHIAEIYRG